MAKGSWRGARRWTAACLLLLDSDFREWEREANERVGLERDSFGPPSCERNDALTASRLPKLSSLLSRSHPSTSPPPPSSPTDKAPSRTFGQRSRHCGSLQLRRHSSLGSAAQLPPRSFLLPQPFRHRPSFLVTPMPLSLH
ncbi:hypothetical protein PANT_5c00099 [Moesziomyces antarcticus T-34]|uniref:Uncharacterized protein n=1 Tax=Pseudozyma antarctica (strain T-34) TaxID=1151754 RepID=M9MCL1_PSEA3|nr:hypothetical protein PANT_5c00099 [Moesziomyces antarcticus T-34]